MEKKRGSLEFFIKKMAGWIRTVSRRAATRLYAPEDLEQEAWIQLWRCLDKYPDMPELEMVGMFKFSFCRRLADLMGQARNKRKDAYSIDIKIDIRSDFRSEHDERWYRAKIAELVKMCDSPELRKWVRKGMKPGKAMTGMPADIYEQFKYLASHCST